MPPHPLLSALSARTEEDSYLVIPVGNKGLVIEKVDGPNHIKVVEEFGYEMYLHAEPSARCSWPTSLPPLLRNM